MDICLEFRYVPAALEIQYNKSIETQIIAISSFSFVSEHIKVRSMSAAYRKIVIPAVAFAALLAVFDYAPVSYLVNSAHAETGIGKDVFKVVVSVFGANKEIGDILALVTVNENSKAKLFDLHSMSPVAINSTSTQNENVVEFVATFPKVAVNTGDVYRSCVITPNTMHQYCEEGSNSPAKRPEFVDISLDKVKKSDSEKKDDS